MNKTSPCPPFGLGHSLSASWARSRARSATRHLTSRSLSKASRSTWSEAVVRCTRASLIGGTRCIQLGVGLSWEEGNQFKKDAVPTEADHVNRVRAPGRYDATVGSEAEARRIVQQALPHAQELSPAMAGQPYPSPPPGVKAWFQVHPAEPGVGNMLPHIKYADWTGGKKGAGGTWGHIFFPPS